MDGLLNQAWNFTEACCPLVLALVHLQKFTIDFKIFQWKCPFQQGKWPCPLKDEISGLLNEKTTQNNMLEKNI